jgi:hypothetical protein
VGEAEISREGYMRAVRLRIVKLSDFETFSIRIAFGPARHPPEWIL